jgi:hypothetical protein
VTNILSLPQLNGAQTQFIISNNADWRDSIAFAAVGSPPPSGLMIGSVIVGQSIITGLSATSNIVAGMPISQTFEIPAGVFVGEVLSTTSVSMVNIVGVSVNALATNPQANIYFQPVPLDITGIFFWMELRTAVGNIQPWLNISTVSGLLVNGGTTGVLAWNVPSAYLLNLPITTYYADLIAEGDGVTVNLFQAGPCTVQIVQGITL